MAIMEMIIMIAATILGLVVIFYAVVFVCVLGILILAYIGMGIDWVFKAPGLIMRRITR